jgi:DNA polymerase-3 subunit gamma/tau
VTPTIPHQALYRRWRAQTFSQIVGQEAVVETLRNAVRTERVSHAVLFVGPRGTGKTSLARILAKAVNCTNLQDGDPCDACEACVAIREGTTLDVLEIDAASNRGINEVRDLRERLAYPPGHLRRKVYILDEAHQITKEAWNALLKSLEEPPDFVIFMFASTEPSGFPPAILSRLQRFDVRRLTVPEIEGKLTRILEADARAIEPAALTLIARLAAGGMRDAESILDQLLSMTTELITEAAVRDLLGMADAAAVDGFVEALLTGDAAGGIGILDRLEERGRDPRALLDQVVDAVRSRLVTEATSGGTDRGANLTAVARRLIAIDPDRAGIGGLRLQLELALFAGPSMAPSATAAAVPTAETTPAPVAASTPTPEPRSATQPRTARASGTRPAPTAPSPMAEAPEAAAGRAADAEPPEPRAALTEPAAAPTDPGPTTAAAPSEPPPATAAAPSEPPPATAAAPKDSAPAATSPQAAEPQAADTQLAAAEPQPATATNGTDLSLERIVAAWPDIVAVLSRQPAIKQLILTCRPVALDGSVVTLGYPEEQAFLREIAERKKAAIEAGIHEVIGHDVGVRCVVANIEVAAAATGGEDGFLMAEARRIFGDDLADVVEID